MREPRVLIADIETAPMRVWAWRTGQQYIGVDQIDRSSFILCWCAKFLGDKEVTWDALPNHASYKADPTDDSAVVETLVDMLVQADMIVGHNVQKFDLRKVRSRMMHHDMDPLLSVPVFDTLKEMRRVADHDSQKLAYLSRTLLDHEKLRTDFTLWTRCMDGDRSAWTEMVDYCAVDVEADEELYLLIRPWAVQHPNLVLIDPDGTPRCPRCQSDALVKNGERFLTTYKYQRYTCKGCGCPNLRGRKNVLSREQMGGVITNAG